MGIFALPLLTQIISNQFHLARNGIGNGIGSGSGNGSGSFSSTYTGNNSASTDTVSHVYFAHRFLNCNDGSGTSATNSIHGHDCNKKSDTVLRNLSVLDRTYHISSSSTSTKSYTSTKNSSNDSIYTSQSDIAFWCLYCVIVGCLAVYRASATSAFTTLGIVVNDSVDRELRGKATII